MANREVEYKFKIEAYSPETIPMVRLGEYMAQFGRLLANNDSVHFRRIEEGSTVVAAGVKYEAAPKVKSRLHAVKRSEAPPDASEAVLRLNEMLRDDNAIGRILVAANDDEFIEELYLPGKEIPVAQQIGPFNEPASIKAYLYRIGGRDETAHAQLLDAAGRTWNGKLTQAQAQTMSLAGLYRWFNVEGTARWIRDENNEWNLIDFHITTFKLLPDDSLVKDIEHLRSIKGSKWGDLVDPLGLIEKSRRDDDGIH